MKTLFTSILAFILPIIVSSQTQVSYPSLKNNCIKLSQQSNETIADYCELFIDSSTNVTFDNLLRTPSKYRFSFLAKGSEIKIPLGATGWVRFKIKNDDSILIQQFITIRSRIIERTQLFTINERGTIDSSKMIGFDVPFNAQNTPTQYPSFPVIFRPDETCFFYLYLDQRQYPLTTQLELNPIADTLPLISLHLSGFVVGAFFFYVCLAFGMYLFARKKLYLAYFLYALSGFGYFLSTSGMGYEAFWSNCFSFAPVANNVFGCLTIACFYTFTRYFFETAIHYPKANAIIKLGTGLALFLVFTAVFRKQLPIETYKQTGTLAYCCLSPVIITILYVALNAYFQRKQKDALFFLIGFSTYLASLVTILMNESGFRQFKYLADVAMPTFNFFSELTIFLAILSYRLKDEFVKQKLKELEFQQTLWNQRTRISHDLHDDVGSTLNSITVFSEVAKLQTQAINNPEMSKILTRIGDMANQLNDTISDIVWSVNPQNDVFENITTKMRFFAADLLVQQNVVIDFQADEKLNALNLSADTRKNFYLIFKEAITNIYKYAHCSTLRIHFELLDSQIKMRIIDDGVGFDCSKISVGNGQTTMQDRAKNLNGCLKVLSKPNEGTEVHLTFPYREV